MIVHLITKEFRSLGAFLEVLFHGRDFSVNDPRAPSHEHMVTSFLNGDSNIGMADIIDLIYDHPQSRPTNDNPESQLYFCLPDVANPKDINFACPALSTWALQKVGPEMRRQVGNLTQNDPDDPEDITQLRASTNGRAKYIRLATWDHLGWVRVISSLTLSHNRYASGYLALPLAVCQFAWKAHVDEKRIMSHFGFSVHDSTARACLDSLTDSSLAKLRESVWERITAGTMCLQIVLDNVQQYCRVCDQRIGRQDVLKVGMAATSILLEDCAPDVFDLTDHLDHVMKQERRKLTIDSLFHDIDWAYLQELTAFHWVHILVTFIPQLAHLRKDVSAALKSGRMMKLHLRQCTSVMQPVGTNAEKSTETQGMMHALHDFKSQMGLDEEAMENLIFLPHGDGVSIATIW
ncbi:hypothetical protein B0H10DRAFT_2219902 [Mycena sp. CBHHK59/15]|nr:hypothetical protein B0H10DRAFT_2219902 [Mycena sp. CBHHK59/15]